MLKKRADHETNLWVKPALDPVEDGEASGGREGPKEEDDQHGQLDPLPLRLVEEEAQPHAHKVGLDPGVGLDVNVDVPLGHVLEAQLCPYCGGRGLVEV